MVYVAGEHRSLWLPRPEGHVRFNGGSIPHILPAASVESANDQPARESEIVTQAVPSVIDASISGAVAAGFDSPGALPGGIQDIPHLRIGFSEIDAPVPPEDEAKLATVEAPNRIAQPPQVEPARLLKKTMPVYPSLARTARVEGVVTVQADISESGALENVTALDGHPMLIDAAIQAVRQWRYAPARLHGRPTRSSVTVTVRFSLIYQ